MMYEEAGKINEEQNLGLSQDQLRQAVQGAQYDRDLMKKLLHDLNKNPNFDVFSARVSLNAHGIPYDKPTWTNLPDFGR